MNRGLYTAGIGMMTQMDKMDAVANNIANSNTTAFKKDNTIIQSFSEELMYKLESNDSLIKRNNNIGSVTLGNFISNVYTDFSSGSLQETGGTYDLAIDGEGFFVIEGQNTEKYTRDGAFTLDNQGYLVTKNGDRVLGENGLIQILDGNVTISEKGYIYSNGEYVDKLKLIDIENKNTLTKDGDNLYSPTESTVLKEFNGKVIQSYLEGSNVNIVDEMVKMISLTRVYEANSRMVKTQDELLRKAVTEIANK